MSAAKPRLLYANRSQGEFRDESLENLLPSEHPARDVWQFVETLDLSPLLAEIRSVPGHAGAPAIDPKILMALWLYATINGVGSSRALAELCENHLAYRWLCGGVPVCYHVLSDFRSRHTEVLNQLLTETTAVMMFEGLVEMQRVAQDGMRVRAAAGAASFRRPETIEKCLEVAKEQVEALQSQSDEDAGAASRREQAARKRAAADRVSRLQAAQRELAKLQEANAGRVPSRQVPPSELRASTTDPECRKMKMPDGGFRPGYNVQFATTTDSGVIVGVAVTNEGTDNEQMSPMLKQIEDRFGEAPKEMLVDGGFASLNAIDEAERNGTTVYSPVKGAEKQKEEETGKDPYARKRMDTEATAQWRARMATEEAKTIYKQRASTAEWVNAQTRNRDFYMVTVRGQKKVLAVALWHALAHNFGRMKKLRAAVPGDTARRANESPA